jgi:hypothetical protein
MVFTLVSAEGGLQVLVNLQCIVATASVTCAGPTLPSSTSKSVPRYARACSMHAIAYVAQLRVLSHSRILWKCPTRQQNRFLENRANLVKGY